MTDSLMQRSLQDYQYGNFGPSKFAKPEAVTLIPWSTQEGKELLFKSEYSASFFQLANFFQPQINSVYCGVASAVIVLNALSQPLNKAPYSEALSIPVGDSGKIINVPAYSQLTFLGEKTEVIKKKRVIEYREKNEAGEFRPGLSLEELSGLIEVYGFSTHFHHPSADGDLKKGEEKFRTKLKEVLVNSTAHLIIHFRSDLLGGLPRGHISPVAAYEAVSDRALILDVAGHKGPWYWAPVSHIYQSIAFIYDTQPKGGGYMVVSE